MVEIISKSDGPRREDAEARRFLRENSGTINKIAQQLSGGRIRAPARPEAPPVAGPRKRVAASLNRDAETKPYVEVSLNGRVIVVDFNSGRQLHHVGEIRGRGPTRRFLLATRENHFFTPLDDPMLARLRDLDGLATPDDKAQEDLVRQLEARLGYADPARTASEGANTENEAPS